MLRSGELRVQTLIPTYQMFMQQFTIWVILLSNHIFTHISFDFFFLSPIIELQYWLQCQDQFNFMPIVERVKHLCGWFLWNAYPSKLLGVVDRFSAETLWTTTNIVTVSLSFRPSERTHVNYCLFVAVWLYLVHFVVDLLSTYTYPDTFGIPSISW